MREYVLARAIFQDHQRSSLVTASEWNIRHETIGRPSVKILKMNGCCSLSDTFDSEEGLITCSLTVSPNLSW
jgi:hypothetical protein